MSGPSRIATVVHWKASSSPPVCLPGSLRPPPPPCGLASASSSPRSGLLVGGNQLRGDGGSGCGLHGHRSLSGGASGRDTACEKNKTEFRTPELVQGQKMADWRPRAVGSSYIAGPFAPPIHFRILPSSLKGQDPVPKPTQGYPPPAPPGSTGYLSSLVCLPRGKQLFASLTQVA